MKLIFCIATGILLGGLMLDSALILKRYGTVNFVGNMFTHRSAIVEIGKVNTQNPTFKKVFVKGMDTVQCKQKFGVKSITNEVARCTIDHYELVNDENY